LTDNSLAAALPFIPVLRTGKSLLERLTQIPEPVTYRPARLFRGRADLLATFLEGLPGLNAKVLESLTDLFTALIKSLAGVLADFLESLADLFTGSL
jgi:hypothetical protein